MDINLLQLGEFLIIVAGFAFGAKKWYDAGKLKKANKELNDVVNAVKNSIAENSPGGKTITKKEAEKIGIETIELIYTFYEPEKEKPKLFADGDSPEPKPPKTV